MPHIWCSDSSLGPAVHMSYKVLQNKRISKTKLLQKPLTGLQVPILQLFLLIIAALMRWMLLILSRFFYLHLPCRPQFLQHQLLLCRLSFSLLLLPCCLPIRFLLPLLPLLLLRLLLYLILLRLRCLRLFFLHPTH